MNTGERIKKLRILLGMSQEELGEKVGVKKAAIHKYESGIVVNLKRSIIDELANALNTTPAYLMGWDDEQKTAVDTYSPLEQLELLKAYQPSDEGYRIAMLFDKADKDDKTIVRAALKKYEGLIPESLFAGRPNIKKDDETVNLFQAAHTEDRSIAAGFKDILKKDLDKIKKAPEAKNKKL